jgi:phosphotriesterase-related protein
MAQVSTVLGPVPGEELGITLPHEHLQLDLYRDGFVFRDWRLRELDVDLICAELANFTEAGGRTLIEVTPPDLGRKPAVMAKIARRTGLNVVMGLGRYREPFYERSLWDRTTRDIAEEFIREIRDGVDGIRPGVIGEIGVHGYHMTPAEERVHRAAARAHVATGLPITTHAAECDVGLVQLDVFEEEGADLTRVAVGHSDSHPDLAYHQAIVDRGAFVEFDLIRGLNEHETAVQVGLVRELADRGHVSRVLLSQDVCCRAHLRAYGGPGYAYVVRDFASMLLDAGLTQRDIDTMLIDNPRALLTGERPPS